MGNKQSIDREIGLENRILSNSQSQGRKRERERELSLGLSVEGGIAIEGP